MAYCGSFVQLPGGGISEPLTPQYGCPRGIHSDPRGEGTGRGAHPGGGVGDLSHELFLSPFGLHSLAPVWLEKRLRGFYYRPFLLIHIIFIFRFQGLILLAFGVDWFPFVVFFASHSESEFFPFLTYFLIDFINLVS